jgi:hypothetical protein
MKTNQVIHFSSGNKRTLFNIIGVKDNEFCHLMLEDGRKVLINKDNVDMIEIIPEGFADKTWGAMKGVYSANEDNKNASSD